MRRLARARRRLTELIATLAAAPYVSELSQELEREVAILWVPMNSASRRQRSAAGWRKIAKAIAAGDPDAASPHFADLERSEARKLRLLRRAAERFFGDDPTLDEARAGIEGKS